MAVPDCAAGRPVAATTSRSLLVGVALLLAGVIGVGAARPVTAQTLGLDAATRDLPRWMEAWSPLAEAPGARPSTLPSTGTALPMLLAPTPRLGLFWGAGQVAALPLDIREGRAEVLLSHGARRGDFRRPLDPPAGDANRLTAIGWRPVGERSAMVGRVALNRDSRDPSPWRADPDVYGPSPFSAVDTSSSGDHEVSVRLDGAAGWQLGRWSLGAGGGYETLDQRTDFSAIAREARRTSTAVTAGVVRRFPAMELGLQLGWRVDGTTTTVREGIPGSVPVVYELFGLRDVARSSVQGVLYRRADVTVPTVALALSGEGWGGRFSASARAARRTERNRHGTDARSPYNGWDADGRSFALSYQRAVELPGDTRVLVTARAHRDDLNGTATLSARPGLTMYTANNVETGAAVELRLPASTGTADGSAAWGAVLVAEVTRSRREQTDSSTTLRSQLETLSPGWRVEVERALTRQLRLGGGLAMTSISRRGEIPVVRAPGPAYRDVVGPNLGLAGTDARPLAATVLLRWLDGSRSYWLAGRLERVEPINDRSGPLPLTPLGRRTLRALVVGMTFSPRS